LEPSPGYGPAVSSGIAALLDAVIVEVAPAAAVVAVVAVVGAVVADVDALPRDAQPTRAARPAPANSFSIPRRATSAGKSWARPRSWSCGSVSMCMDLTMAAAAWLPL
jgi:hypothetical protein